MANKRLLTFTILVLFTSGLNAETTKLNPPQSLTEAAARADYTGVVQMLEQGSSLDVRQNGMSILMHAAGVSTPRQLGDGQGEYFADPKKDERIKIVNLLIKSGAKVSKEDQVSIDGLYMDPKLVSAIAKKNLKLVEQLLPNSNPNQRITTETLLTFALGEGSDEIAVLIIKTFPSLLTKTGGGGYPVIYAASRNRMKALKVMLSMGVNPNCTVGYEHPTNAMTVAKEAGHEEIVNILSDAGAEEEKYEYCEQ